MEGKIVTEWKGRATPRFRLSAASASRDGCTLNPLVSSCTVNGGHVLHRVAYLAVSGVYIPVLFPAFYFLLTTYTE